MFLNPVKLINHTNNILFEQLSRYILLIKKYTHYFFRSFTIESICTIYHSYTFLNIM